MVLGNRGIQMTNRVPENRRWFALSAVLITLFFSSLDLTAVATAMPTIIGDLKGFSVYAWVFTAYMIASTVTIPVYGKLSDIYGRKPFYILGLALFMLGSALSGQAHSMRELILFRAFQGLGGGALLTMPQATVGDIFNPRERGRWMGVITMTYGVATIVGPALGGWITDRLGWRWIFYINLPVAAIALAFILFALPRVRTEKKASVDWRGTVLLTSGLVFLLLAVTWAGGRYAWGSPVILALLVLSFSVLGLFTWAERRAAEPILPMHFFRVRLFAIANSVSFLLGMTMYGTMLYFPLYIQGVLNLSPEKSGVVMAPMMFGFIGAAVIAGLIITRTGKYKILAMTTAGIMCGGLFLVTRLGTGSTSGLVVRDTLIAGMGIGGLMPTLNVAIQNAFPYKVLGVVTASQQFVSLLGGIIAAPILGTVLTNTFSSRLQQLMSPELRTAIAGLPASQQQAYLDPQSLIDTSTQAMIRTHFSAFGVRADALYHGFLDAVHQALAGGMRRLFFLSLLVGLISFALCLFLPEIRLKRDEFYHDSKPAPGGLP